MKGRVLFLFLAAISPLLGQQAGAILSYDDFMTIVREHHPIARQSELQGDRGKANLTQARGGFDPKFEGSVNQKYFKDIQYYSYMQGKVKVPTWFGITAQAGYELNTGEYLNPSARVPDDGLWYAGVNVSLLNGLLLDQRRAELKKAKIYLESAEIEQRFLLNQLLFDASAAYWDWFKAYAKVQIYKEAVDNAQVRFEGVKRSAFLGDRPFIDTLESGIQLQNRKIGLLEEELNLKNKSQYLEVFLWKEGFVPLELDSLTRPSERQNLGAAVMDLHVYDQLDSLISFHPALMYGQNKIDMKSLDLKLKRQGILPNVDMKYNLLSEPLGLDQLNQVSSSNYNWGLTVNYPLFTRKERGSIQLTQIQLEQDQMDLLTKRELVEYKVKMAINSYQTSNLQIDQYQQVTNDYERLLDAEKQLFSIGESSLFMINSREKAFIDAQLKLVDYQFENQLSKQRVYYELVTIP